ncbi:hypothetical protein NDU88_008578, partial [Pleurodeles waltl]
ILSRKGVPRRGSHAHCATGFLLVWLMRGDAMKSAPGCFFSAPGGPGLAVREGQFPWREGSRLICIWLSPNWGGM